MNENIYKDSYNVTQHLIENIRIVEIQEFGYDFLDYVVIDNPRLRTEIIPVINSLFPFILSSPCIFNNNKIYRNSKDTKFHIHDTN